MKAKYEFPQMKYSEQKGLVSIIVPIYNTEEIYLRECLDSILLQTFKNWEAILLNDGSTNKDTGKIIDEYTKKSFLLSIESFLLFFLFKQRGEVCFRR